MNSSSDSDTQRTPTTALIHTTHSTSDLTSRQPNEANVCTRSQTRVSFDIPSVLRKCEMHIAPNSLSD